MFVLPSQFPSLIANDSQWRISLGLGVIPPFALFFLRLRLQEPEQTKKNSMANTRTPYWLVIKYYWWRLTLVSLIWFIYDVSSPLPPLPASLTAHSSPSTPRASTPPQSSAKSPAPTT